MAVDSALLGGAEGGEAGDTGCDFAQRQDILKYNIDWAKLRLEPIEQLSAGLTGGEVKDILLTDPDVMSACLAAIASPQDRDDIRAMEYVITIIYDALREDASVFYAFEELLKWPRESGKGSDPNNWMNHLLQIVAGESNASCSKYCANKAAYILTTILSQDSRFLTANRADDGRMGEPIPIDDGVDVVVKALLKACPSSGDGTMTRLGMLESLTNLLKNPEIRKMVWMHSNVSSTIFAVEREAAPPVLYRSVFAMWLCSFDEEVAVSSHGLSLKSQGVVDRLRGILVANRVEKVVRLSLATLKNLLKFRDVCEDIVEKGTLEVVQQLEFEKWRDTDMYDEIKDVAHSIATNVQELSSFERYERELAEGNLKWGFIHSDRFWQENVSKFEKDQFAAVTKLGGILVSDTADPVTLAVACHDIGEFAALHPLGKKKVADFGLKDNIMNLMSRPDAAYREVRREALLCCQKIMLDRWQEVGAAR